VAIQITINGLEYNLPQQGEDPPWGEELSDIIKALADVAATTVGVGDILTTNYTPANNVSSATNVTGLLFDTAAVRSAIISYSINRSTSSTELSECGQMMVTYNTSANSWALAQYSVGDAGLTFSITSGGQIQFVSTNMSGTGYTALMKFSAKAFTQT
jgi:hypothetical protein